MGDSKDPKEDLQVTPPPRLSRTSVVDGDVVTKLNVDQLNETLSKITSAVNRSAKHTIQIPEIRSKVDETKDRVVILDTKMDGITERVSKVENKVDRGHDCYQIDVIADLKDIQRAHSQRLEDGVSKDVEQVTKLDALSKSHQATELEVRDIRMGPRRMFFSLIGVMVTVATAAIGAVWFLAELKKDVEFERAQRTEQFQRIETQMKSIGNRADTAPVRRALIKIEDGIDQVDHYAKICEGMTRTERRHMKTLLLRRGRPVPASCATQ